ncbi:hypothetical protein [Dankookia sp. P2]|uniref:hypothetical protein n=1 Tax=Dankookia sp. P2 TaxID=3423955 RepID=UPI003D676198
MARSTWAVFRVTARTLGRRGDGILVFCGPVILVLLVGTWALTLTLGTALIMHPLLGIAITAQSGGTPTDFVTAMYAGGNSMAIVGTSDFVPRTGWTRMLYLFNSLVGMSVVSLTLTYIMQVYTALQQRNLLGLKFHLLSAETDDAAELVARLGARGQSSVGYSDLAELGFGIGQVKEAHHFYPVLFYFRFRQPFYCATWSAGVALDTVALIRSALDDESYEWLKESGAVEQLWRASLIVVRTLEETYLRGGVREPASELSGEVQSRWCYRYQAAVQRLRRAGINTTADEQAGAETYISLRSQWEPLTEALASAMAHRVDQLRP